MIPAVWPGDVVTVKRRALVDLRPGNIVLCHREGSLIAHRVKRLSPTHLMMRGDSLSQTDEPLPHSQVIGQVVGIQRKGQPVSLTRSTRHRVVSCLIRRSDLLARMTLRIGSDLWSAPNTAATRERAAARHTANPLRVLKRTFA